MPLQRVWCCAGPWNQYPVRNWPRRGIILPVKLHPLQRIGWSSSFAYPRFACDRSAKALGAAIDDAALPQFNSENVMTASALISAHLNAPFGAVLMESDILNSLTSGRLSARTEQVNAVLGTMFVEVEPRLIARCALEANVSVKQANLLYLDTITHSFPKCPHWESSVAFLV